MKQRFTGLIILLLVIVSAFGYNYYQKNRPKPPEVKETVKLNGYLGGEKIGIFEDSEIKAILKDKFNLELDYLKAGSLDMITAKQEGMSYLFPSSQIALELYKREHKSSPVSDIVFNTPLVIYTHKVLADAFVTKGIAQQQDGVYYMDMKKLLELMDKNTKWSDIGVTAFDGVISLFSTDPLRSNSGFMFSGLLANLYSNGVATSNTLADVNPKVKNYFDKLGYLERSSSDIFDKFTTYGLSSQSFLIGYENQILEFAAKNPKGWEKLKDTLVVMYPNPTVWSSHVYISLNEQGNLPLAALKSTEIQDLAWKKHGFRTGVPGIDQDPKIFNVPGVPQSISNLIPMPNVSTMDNLLNYLKQ